MLKKPALLLSPLLLILLSISCRFWSSALNQEESSAEEILFQDSFSDPTSGWDRVRRDDMIADYDSGTYRIQGQKEYTDFWTNPGLHFEDVSIDVQAWKIHGPDDNSYGVICRYQNQDNFYFFLISSDGFYGIGKIENGERILLEPEQMLPSNEIRVGEEPNHLHVTCVGPELSLSVNQVLLAETRDTSFSDGDVGLIAGTFAQPGVDIRFDNLLVKTP